MIIGRGRASSCCRWLRFSPGEHSGEHLPGYVTAEGGSSPTDLIPTECHEVHQHINGYMRGMLAAQSRQNEQFEPHPNVFPD